MTRKRGRVKHSPTSGFLLGGLYVLFLGIIPYFLQYTDVIPTSKKKENAKEKEQMKGEERG
jgi:hypothetical protein